MKQLSGRLAVLYLIGGVCTILSLVLTLFSLYILPNIFFGVDYPLPQFLMRLAEWLQAQHNFTGVVLAIATISPVIILAVSFGLVSKAFSRRFEINTLDVTSEQAKELQWQSGWRQNIGIILLAAGLLLLVIFLLDFVIIIDELSHLSP